MRLVWSGLALSLILLSACGGSHETRPQAEQAAPVPVKTVAVATVIWPSVYEATGTVRARTSAVLSSKVVAYVREVRVRAGDRVSAGQTLVVLDSRDLDAGRRQAEAALSQARSGVPGADSGIAAAKAQMELAEATMRRMQELFDKKSISNQEYDEASAKLRVAQAEHQMALARKSQLEDQIRQASEAAASAGIMRDYAEVRAPFAGIVTERIVEPGTLAAPGSPLLTVEQSGALRLEAAVEESRMAAIRPGMPVEIVIDALSITTPGRVSEIVPSVDAASRAFTVKIDLPSRNDIRSGLFGRARFGAGERHVLAIPEESLMTQGQVQSVLVDGNGTARRRLLTAGERREGKVEVLSGLAPGDRVISPPPAGLADGMKVEVRP